VCGYLGLYFLILTLYNLFIHSGSSLVLALLYGAISHELIRVSYNTYFKVYARNKLRKIAGSMGAVTSTMSALAQSVATGSNAPLDELHDEVELDIMLENTITMVIIQLVQRAKRGVK
jgi:hypothetical protein